MTRGAAPRRQGADAQLHGTVLEDGTLIVIHVHTDRTRDSPAIIKVNQAERGADLLALLRSEVRTVLAHFVNHLQQQHSFQLRQPRKVWNVKTHIDSCYCRAHAGMPWLVVQAK